MSWFALARYQAIEYTVDYIYGPRNGDADLFSRPPMLGVLRPSMQGLESMVLTLLDFLPPVLKKSKRIYTYASSDTVFVSNLVRDWRTNGGRIVIGAPQGIAATGKSKLIYDLAICIPDVSRCTYDAAALLRRGLPFACLMETSLLCRIPEKDNWERDEQIASMLPGTARVEAAYTWVIDFCAVDKHIQYCIRKASTPSKRIAHRIPAWWRWQLSLTARSTRRA